MSDARLDDPVESLPAISRPQRRNCLRCREVFDSEWSGERICSRCKSSTAWRSGTPLALPGTGSRR